MATQIPSDLLLTAYREGVFPMAVAPGDIRWFSPDPRGVIPLNDFHVPHGTKTTLRDPAWETRIDSAFSEVMHFCAEREETWIDDTIHASYTELFHQGFAHSVEIWRDGDLAGGLYGVALGGAFFGESMFHRVTGASKVALARLVEILRSGGFLVLDIQWVTPHLERFGAVEIPRAAYLKVLRRALRTKTEFSLPQSE